MSTTLSPIDVWGQVCSDLETVVSPGIFNTWILPNVLTSLEERDGVVVCILESSSSFHISILEKSFRPMLEASLVKAVGHPIKLVFKVGNFLASTPKQSRTKIVKKTKNESSNITPTEISQTQSLGSLFSSDHLQQSQQDFIDYKISQTGLNRNYIFDTFAVSSSNEMAHAAAVAVSQNPGKAYNVLFLYGGVGVGKTHLMQAVGQNILKNNPDMTLLYRTGEEFMNEIVEALQTKKTVQLKQRYRSVQVLLIDDIQFMAGKRTMQEEFFHTFNAVLKARGQVILTSDRPPYEIHPLDDRIQSRLEGGLIIDIQQPSFELRTAIVLIKAKQFQFNLPMDLAQKIASAITSTRRLEGVVKVLHSEHILRHKPVTLDLVEQTLQGLQKDELGVNQKIHAKPNDVIKTIANQYHIKQIDLKGPKRTKHIATARHLAMFIIKEQLGLPYEEIGRYFGGRDHSSVMHAVRKIENEIQTDADLRLQLQAVKTSLSGIRVAMGS